MVAWICKKVTTSAKARILHNNDEEDMANPNFFMGQIAAHRQRGKYLLAVEGRGLMACARTRNLGHQRGGVVGGVLRHGAAQQRADVGEGRRYVARRGARQPSQLSLQRSQAHLWSVCGAETAISGRCTGIQYETIISLDGGAGNRC